MSRFLEHLAALSTAEQIFEAIGLPYEQSVLDVNRLHILKRFRDHLDFAALADRDDATVRQACHTAMACAYGEFGNGNPGPRTFTVFRQRSCDPHCKGCQ
jgi:nitrogenase-stabilizing/protective protein